MILMYPWSLADVYTLVHLTSYTAVFCLVLGRAAQGITGGRRLEGSRQVLPALLFLNHLTDDEGIQSAAITVTGNGHTNDSSKYQKLT